MVSHRSLIACVVALALCGCPEDTRRGTGEGDDLTPGQVIGAARAINVGEIDQTSTVKNRLTDPALSELADRIIQDHRAALQSLEQVSTQLGIVGEESDLTKELQDELHATTDELASKQGDELDREFVDAQVDGHQRALEIIDDKLMPATADPALQQYLNELRGVVAAHLEMAKGHRGGAEGMGPMPEGERAPPEPTRETAPSGEPR